MTADRAGKPALDAVIERAAANGPAHLRDRLNAPELAAWRPRETLTAGAAAGVAGAVLSLVKPAPHAPDGGAEHDAYAALYLACSLIAGGLWAQFPGVAWTRYPGVDAVGRDDEAAAIERGLYAADVLWLPGYRAGLAMVDAAEAAGDADARAAAVAALPRHPVAPLIAAWIEAHPPPANTRRLAITSGPTGAPRDIDSRLPMPDAPGPAEQPGAPRLPGFELPDSLAGTVRPALLRAYDGSQLRSLARGRGATLPERAFVFALLSLSTEQRQDAANGRTVPIELPAATWVADFWPGKRQKGKRGEALFRDVVEAMERVSDIGFTYDPPDGTPAQEWFPVTRRARPVDWRGAVVYDVRFPPGASAGGFLVDRHRLRAYGVDSAPAFRAYLALRQYFDRFGTVKGRMRRAFDGDGERLPGADGYPVIPDADLWALAYQSAASAALSDGSQRLRGAHAVRCLLGKLERAGDVVIEDGRDAADRAGVRLLPPGAKSAERNALAHNLKQRRRANRRP